MVLTFSVALLRVCGPTMCQSPSEFTQKVQTEQPLLHSLWVSPFPPFTFDLRQTRLCSCLNKSEFSLSSSLCSFLSFYSRTFHSQHL